MTLEELRGLALAAVTAACDVVRTAADPAGPQVTAEVKGYGDYVSAVDRAAERAAVDVLRAGAPEIRVMAEESTTAGTPVPAGRVWAVDPLDGTTNFLRGYPIVGVSVGLLEDGVPVAGAVGAPLLGGVWWSGARGLGAYDHNGRRLRVRADDGRGVATTGFPFRRPDRLPRYLSVLEPALLLNEDLRRPGSAALDLAYTAQGSLDGYFELGLSLWDIAAGALLVSEAGGVVTDWSGDPGGPFRGGDILAGAPAWHERMLEVCRAAAPAAPEVS